MPYRVLDTLQQGACDPDYYDGSGNRYMKNAYRTSGIQSWGNTPGYKKGDKPSLTQNFTRDSTKETWPRGKVDYFPTWDTSLYHRMTGLLDQYSDWEPSEGCFSVDRAALSTASEEQAISNALEKAKDQKVNFAQSLGEYRSTGATPGQIGQKAKDLLEYVSKRTGDLIDLTIAAKRGNLTKVLKIAGLNKDNLAVVRRRANRKRVPKELADVWLIYSYGVVPMLNDIQGVVQILAEMSVPKDFIHRSVGVYSSATTETWTSSKGLGGAWVVSFEREIITRAKCTFEYKLTDQHLHNLSSLGIYGVVHATYELITLSFVLDWAINIGQYLSNLDATRGLTWERGTISSRTYVKVRSTAKGTTAGSWIYDGAAVAESEALLLRRERLGEFPIPPLPQWKNPFSLTHGITAIGLLVQAASRK